MTVLQIRDLDILNFIAKFGYCNIDHIAKFCNLSSIQTKRVINRLSEAGYVRSEKVLSNSASYVFLTPKSGKMLEIKAVNKPFLNTLNHDTLLVDLYFWLINKIDVNCEFIKTDKQIRKELGVFDSESKQRIPDLIINENIAIELEISEKPKTRLQEIVNFYIMDESIKLVCYFLKSLSLLKKIEALTMNHPKFKFMLFELDINGQFNDLGHYTKDGMVEIDKKSLFDVPVINTKKFGNYVF